PDRAGPAPELLEPDPYAGCELAGDPKNWPGFGRMLTQPQRTTRLGPTHGARPRHLRTRNRRHRRGRADHVFSRFGLRPTRCDGLRGAPGRRRSRADERARVSMNAAHVLVESSLLPDAKTICATQRIVDDLSRQILADDDLGWRLAMVAHELLDNARKY